jgi:hypothetical protein
MWCKKNKKFWTHDLMDVACQINLEYMYLTNTHLLFKHNPNSTPTNFGSSYSSIQQTNEENDDSNQNLYSTSQ